MARSKNTRVLIRLYDAIPEHQKIVRWINGYSGKALQQILCSALRVGLPQVLQDVQPENPERCVQNERVLLEIGITPKKAES